MEASDIPPSTYTTSYLWQKIAPDGNLIAKWGSEGTGDGQFQHLHDIAVGPGTRTPQSVPFDEHRAYLAPSLT